MNNKITLTAGAAAITLCLAFIPAAQAQSNTDSLMHPNFYAGVYGGYGWTDADIASGGILDVNGGDYGFMLGYEMGAPIDAFAGMTAAIEVHMGWSNANETGAVSVKKNNEWGISFRPGFAFLSDNMPLGLKPYGILGYRATEFEEDFGGTTEDHTYDGFELGIGSELVAYDDIGLRLDYTHVFYKGEGGIDPSEDDLRLGLAYHF